MFGFYRNFAYNLKKGKIMINFSQFDSLIINAKGEEEFMSYVRAMVAEKTDRVTLLPIIGQFIGEGSTFLS